MADDDLVWLREENARLRGERDAARQELAPLLEGGERTASAELRLLSEKLAKDIRHDFYEQLKQLLWLLGLVASGVAVTGYLTISGRVDDIIAGVDGKVSTAVQREVEEREADVEKLRDSVIEAVADFRTRAEAELRTVMLEKDRVIDDFRKTADTALSAIETERLRVQEEGAQTRASFAEYRFTKFEISRVESVAKGDATIEIPVVVHVVYNKPEQNISMDQIESQMKVLNDDFQARNADLSTVPAAFAPLIGNAAISFFLAKVDPAGKPTSGVTRTETEVGVFASDDQIKFTAQGGADAWDTSRILNIWVGNMGTGIIGVSQFPGGPAETDGVVINYTAFGTMGTATAPFERGRATTAQVARWLDIRHIWGDDGGDCTGSDLVDDTPNQAGPNWGAPVYPSVSCDNGPNGDMFMNFADYVDDGTMVMFTKGQVARMRETLATKRASIVLQ